MSAYESSHKSLLQGVSQQIPKERQPGQVGAQENMLSDAVTNPRRRPGAQYAYNLALTDATTDSIRAWYTDIAGEAVHILLNCATGTITILDAAYNVDATLEAGAYLTNSDPSHIRATTIRDEFYLLNTDVLPTLGAAVGGTDPSLRGYFYIASGAFSKEYSVTVQTSAGSYTATYTTPTGAGAGDAALSAPTYIAEQLRAAIQTNMATVGISAPTKVTAYVYLEATGGTTDVVVNSSTGSAYIQVSKDGYTNVVGNLPAQLPSGADGFIMRVGDTKLPQYYTFDYTTTAWLESGDFDSPGGLEDMPISITKVANVWTLVTDAFEGRLAGDDESNPTPRFVEFGISGMGAYQGRLVLLSGPFVRLSASNKPRRMYRSTVTSVLDSDPIEVGSSANSSASYQYAVPFQKDLVLFSSKYQALIPSGNAALTPRTATVVLTSTHAADMTSEPVTLGRTLMYPSTMSTDFFGVLEMVPSQYTDSQYISAPATDHIPRYLGGRCRFSVSSGVGGTVLFAPSGDKQSLIVHEYIWDGDQKVQKAWHRWTFQYDIAAAYFANDQIVILFVKNETVVAGIIDPRIGQLTSDSTARPYMDLYSTVTITDNVVTPPAWLLTFDPAALADVSLAKIDGPMAGERIGFTVVGDTLETVRSHPSGDAALGFAYQSLLAPTPPVVRDFNEVAVSTNKHTILRYFIGTKNSAEYKVEASDLNSGADTIQTVGTLYWSSADLIPGEALTADESIAVVPLRTAAASTVLLIYTDGLGELNITSLEYVAKYHQKIRRR